MEFVQPGEKKPWGDVLEILLVLESASVVEREVLSSQAYTGTGKEAIGTGP